MSQNDFTIANQGFPAFRADLNSALQALASNNSGATAPSTTFANMWWYDSANNIMYIRNEDNDAWIKFAEVDQTNDKIVFSGLTQFDAGSASAPSISFDSDPNTGMYSGGADILKLATGGTDAITIEADQDVNFAGDIKSGSSAGSLTIYGGGTNQGGKIVLDGGNNDGDIVFHAGQFTATPLQRMLIANNGDISFYEDTGTTPKLFWDASAESLGIGTSSPASILEVTGAVTDQWAGKFVNTHADGYGVLVRTSGSTSNDIAFDVQKNATESALRVLGDGNIGIGNTGPGYPLHVGTSSLDKRGMFTGSNQYRLGLQNGSSNVVWLGSGGADNFRISNSSGQTRFEINSSGEILIGTSTSVNASFMTINATSGGAGKNNITLCTDSTGTSMSHLLFANPNGNVGSVTTSGTSTAYNTTSDHRLKENVTANWDATTRLKQLNPVRFNFIADADTTIDGFLAHEVQSVVPEAITGTHNEVDDDGNPVYQGIDQSKLVPLLVKTIQELEARITALETA